MSPRTFREGSFFIRPLNHSWFILIFYKNSTIAGSFSFFIRTPSVHLLINLNCVLELGLGFFLTFFCQFVRHTLNHFCTPVYTGTSLGLRLPLGLRFGMEALVPKTVCIRTRANRFSNPIFQNFEFFQSSIFFSN